MTDEESTAGLLVDTAPVTTGERAGARPARIVWVRGEVDLLTHDLLESELERVLSRGAERIVIDVSAMAFCDARGLGVLMRTVALAAEDGCHVAVVGLSPRLSVWCSLLWPGPQPTHHASVAAALDAVRTDRAPAA